ncbi:MAG: hypothetical protein HFJ46_04255 [Clostridia bacterium]|nr:hypothetical protein [Clostridia bacterium]
MMNQKQAMQIVNKTFFSIFNQNSPFSLEEILSEFAFDVKLPQQVSDSLTGKPTWAISINPTKFISQKNMEKYDELKGWMQPKVPVSNLKEVLKLWKKINYTTTERIYDSENISQSDTIYKSQNVFRSSNCNMCKNIIFMDGCTNSEYSIACQRSNELSFCIRVDDSGTCSNSYNVICSAKISNSLFIQDCNSLHECIFCSHISNKQYCIANMQFEKEEYFAIKKEIINWILNKS